MDSAAPLTADPSRKRTRDDESTAAAASSGDEQAARDLRAHALHQLDLALRGSTSLSAEWATAALQFAQTHLHEQEAIAAFQRLCETRADSSVQGQKPAAHSASSTPSAAPAVAAAAATAPAAAAAAAPSVSSSGVLASVSHVSLLVPRGRYQLQLSLEGATFAVPAAPAKSLSVRWSDVESVVDVADVNKRDWLVVILLRKGKALTVGKQVHQALVLKMLATDKLKAGRISVTDPSPSTPIAELAVQERMRAYVAEHAGAGSTKLSEGLVSLLRSLPSLTRSASFVAHDPSIFTSQKGLACVSCKYGVEDGALYLLRTGLLFLKPVVSVSLAELDGITPARGMSSTFDMKVGVVGQKHELPFIMIDPKEEAAIGKYCAFLATEQARMEKQEKRDRERAAAGGGAAAGEDAGSSAANSISIDESSTPPPPPAAAAASSAAAAAPDDVAPQQVEGAISAANVIAGPRSSRRARPTSFVGMDTDEDKASAAAAGAAAAAGGQPAAAAASAAQAPPDSDGEESDSSDEDEWSDGDDDSSSDDSAEYDSDKDAEEIHSEDERQREREKEARRNAQSDSSSEDEAEDEEEQEEGEAPTAPSAKAASAADAIAQVIDDDDDSDVEETSAPKGIDFDMTDD